MMVSRDDEEYERRRQQIIDGALAVFSAKGFDKATNQEIADAAGIGSPGLIYHYFESKADLLRQLVKRRSPMLQRALRDDAIMEMAPREALQILGSAFLAALHDPENRRLFRVIMSEALRDPTVAETWHRSSSMPIRGALVRYLGVKMQAGVLRKVDPMVAASCFLGSFVVYALSSEVFGRNEAPRVDSETMVATAVEIFLQGLEAA